MKNLIVGASIGLLPVFSLLLPERSAVRVQASTICAINFTSGYNLLATSESISSGVSLSI